MTIRVLLVEDNPTNRKVIEALLTKCVYLVRSVENGLLATEAELHGAIQYESGNGKDNIGYWTNPNDFANWTFNVDHPGSFQVAAEIASMGAGSFEIVLGEQSISGVAPNTGDYTKFRSINLAGTLEIVAPGIYTIAVKPVKAGWQPINLKSLMLKPAAH